MFEKIMFFSTTFSRFFVVLASQNGSKMKHFFKLFRKRRFGENPCKTLAVRSKIKVRASRKSKKFTKKSIQERTRPKHRKKPAKNWFWPPFRLPKTSQNRSNIEPGPEKIGSRTKLVSRRYGNLSRVIANQRGLRLLDCVFGFTYD